MSCSFGIKSSLRYCGRNGTEARPSLQAVDACFKLLYILDTTEYPKPAAAVWPAKTRATWDWAQVTFEVWYKNCITGRWLL